MKRSFIAVACCATLVGCSKGQEITEPTNMEDGSTTAATTTDNSGELWVKDDRAERRTFPSDRAPSVGILFFREAATPLETKDGWTRITKYYAADCEGGKNQYVKHGDKACTAANGYKPDGTFAEWVRSDQLVAQRPADPAADAKEDEKLVAQSDDFKHYHKQFAAAARKLISQGRCTEGDFNEIGGWTKSVTAYADQPVYFTYCGGMTQANKVYLNVKTGAFL